jgi:hypothetical protein
VENIKNKIMEEKRYFQWLCGEKQGEILVFDHIEEDNGLIFICFKDKSRINESFVVPLNQTDATNKMMAEVDSPNNIWKFKEEWVGRQEERWALNEAQERVCVDPFVPGRKVINLIPPRRSAPRTSSFGNVVNQQVQPVVQVATSLIDPQSIDKNDPVYILMSKSKKIDTDIQMTLTIALPSKSLYNLAKESFEDGGSKVIEYIIENITIKEIKEALKVAIADMYENVE